MIFLKALILKLKGFSKSNALGLLLGFSGGALLYWLNDRQIIDLYPIASSVMSTLCALGIECVVSPQNINLSDNVATQIAEAANKTLTVNAFIGVLALALSWLGTELVEKYIPSCKPLAEIEHGAEDFLQKTSLSNTKDSGNG